MRGLVVAWLGGVVALASCSGSESDPGPSFCFQVPAVEGESSGVCACDENASRAQGAVGIDATYVNDCPFPSTSELCCEEDGVCVCRESWCAIGADGTCACGPGYMSVPAPRELDTTCDAQYCCRWNDSVPANGVYCRCGPEPCDGHESPEISCEARFSFCPADSLGHCPIIYL